MPKVEAGPRAGAVATDGGVRFSVTSSCAERIWVCLFAADGRETDRIEMREDGGVFSIAVCGLAAGARYGLRADGRHDPANGLLFDPGKLLMDPYATAIDRPYVYDSRLSARRDEGIDTAELMPRAIVQTTPEAVDLRPPLFKPGGLIYEVPVRAFSMRHPDIPAAERGTIAALAHPRIIDHLTRLGVSAVELMPIVAWIDERHLPPLGLRNAWGYNPVSFMALDPRLAPGGLGQLRKIVQTLRQAGIGVILDLVLNHTGESDVFGPTLSLRGLDNLAYYRHWPCEPGRLVNDTGCGNTMRCDHPVVQQLVIDTLHHFVVHAGIDGFRFDLGTVLGRDDNGFSGRAGLLERIANDPVLGGRILIAEPWDVGPDGYQPGNFRAPFLEWNDRYRDDVRRFWRGDRSQAGPLATRLAGSSDIFGRENAPTTRTINYIAAHDGKSLADVVSYEHRHNAANGEQGRDGHGEDFSWNNGVEGQAEDRQILKARAGDARALLATLFTSRGSIMLTAGDESGRTQGGNNNAYAQDNETTWLDWAGRDTGLEAFVCALSRIRRANAAFFDIAFLNGTPIDGICDVEWLAENGQALDESGWNDVERRRFTMLLSRRQGRTVWRLAILFNGERQAAGYVLPSAGWDVLVHSDGQDRPCCDEGRWMLAGRSVAILKQERE